MTRAALQQASARTLISLEDLQKVFYTDEETHALSGVHFPIAYPIGDLPALENMFHGRVVDEEPLHRLFAEENQRIVEQAKLGRGGQP